LWYAAMTAPTQHRRTRIGIYGGTFDPIHNAHLAIAQTARDAADLDKVLFMVAHVPPHKTARTGATPAQRLAMVEATLSEHPRMKASNLELRRDGPSYTVDTLRLLRALEPEADFFLILGMDSLLDLPNWREPETILQLARILAVPRPGEHLEVPAALADHVQVLPFNTMDISSTDIRRRIAAGQSISHLVPPPVARMIEEQRLYHDNDVRDTASR
ncbi:MAG: nicotinate-nucleotide adenylyltransferase, partial [Candidatus Hydrogenedentales bacterium]